MDLFAQMERLGRPVSGLHAVHRGPDPMLEDRRFGHSVGQRHVPERTRPTTHLSSPAVSPSTCAKWVNTSSLAASIKTLSCGAAESLATTTRTHSFRQVTLPSNFAYWADSLAEIRRARACDL